MFADVPLYWILSNVTNRHSGLVYQGMEHTFSLKLFATSGVEIPLTEYGKRMNVGPHPWGLANSVHLLGLNNGEFELRNFPALTNFFQIPRAGEYLFEARYWYLPNNAGLSGWQLSEPVRLEVIKRPDKITSSEVTNAPSSRRP